MQGKNKNNFINLNLVVFLFIPFVALFDVLMYFITRPSCLTCNTLPEFLKSASLTVFLLANSGYKLKK